MQFDQTKLSEFITLLGGAAVWPPMARAQQGATIRRVAADDPKGKARFEAFQEGLQQLGWDDRNVRIETRWSGGNAENIRRYSVIFPALQLVSLACCTAFWNSAFIASEIPWVGLTSK